MGAVGCDLGLVGAYSTMLPQTAAKRDVPIDGGRGRVFFLESNQLAAVMMSGPIVDLSHLASAALSHCSLEDLSDAHRVSQFCIRG